MFTRSCDEWVGFKCLTISKKDKVMSFVDLNSVNTRLIWGEVMCKCCIRKPLITCCTGCRYTHKKNTDRVHMWLWSVGDK